MRSCDTAAAFLQSVVSQSPGDVPRRQSLKLQQRAALRQSSRLQQLAALLSAYYPKKATHSIMSLQHNHFVAEAS